MKKIVLRIDYEANSTKIHRHNVKRGERRLRKVKSDYSPLELITFSKEV